MYKVNRFLLKLSSTVPLHHFGRLSDAYSYVYRNHSLVPGFLPVGNQSPAVPRTSDSAVLDCLA